MKQLLCLGRGHKPVISILSSSRIFCSRCGIELEYVATTAAAKTDEIPTTIKRSKLFKLR